MGHHYAALRIALYAALLIFSIVLLGLTGTRIHRTLSGNTGFYDPIVVELLVTSSLAILWSLYLMHVIHAARVRGPATSFRGEFIGWFVIWTMFLVGAAIATNFWGNLGFCFGVFSCNVLTDIVAFAWLCFIITTLIGFSAMLFLAGNGGRASINEPLHGRWSARPLEKPGQTSAAVV
ncbi:hypothetical protein GYMLUDRAFT_208559 [Collybiopsis luxurians FD-317 M1]|uniref:MARVEL domain-containing protein n=1 Tax=Collybiopsis luxurians FD-317 M1 TaxID=944289 RepID=A0A0D0BB56_9AGAR|nr:hypothetical protein GYMLUDRAFT_208559 [Collybiopsis luxurians FD-317 M1]